MPDSSLGNRLRKSKPTHNRNPPTRLTYRAYGEKENQTHDQRQHLHQIPPSLPTSDDFDIDDLEVLKLDELAELNLKESLAPLKTLNRESLEELKIDRLDVLDIEEVKGEKT